MKRTLGRYIFILSAIALVWAFCYTVAFGDSIAATYRWNIDAQLDVSYPLPAIQRGENVNLEPTFLLYGRALDLTPARLVIFRYRPTSWTVGSDYPVITGRVVNAAAGQISVPWDSSREFTNSTYLYEIWVQSTTEMMGRGKGTFTLKNSIASQGAGITNPVLVKAIDWATVDHSNIGSAPFLSTFQIDDIQDELDTLFDGTADASVHSFTSAVPPAISATNMFDFPGYLARTGDLVPDTVTNIAKGVEEAVFRVERIDEHNVTLHPAITGEGEIQTTNRLYWVVDGQAVGYISTNGITMLKGSIQLYEEDLNCNVRAYDGAKTAPSMTFFSSPLSGWYRKSVSGAGAWAYAHNSNDVGYINNYGWLLYGTRTYTGYGAELTYCNVTSGYQVNGTNGLTTNISVIVSGGSTQTLRFVGGLLLP